MPREIFNNTFSYRTLPGDCFQSLKRMPDKFKIFSDWYFRIKFCGNSVYVFKLAWHWLADCSVVTTVYTTSCRRKDVLWRCNNIVCPLYRTNFLKSAPNFSKTFESTYEGFQSREAAADVQPATLLKRDSFIEIMQRFQKRIHKNLPHSFN